MVTNVTLDSHDKGVTSKEATKIRTPNPHSHPHPHPHTHLTLSNETRRCISEGNGSWIRKSDRENPYLIGPSFTGPKYASSRWFWGACDAGLNYTRSAVQWKWKPTCRHSDTVVRVGLDHVRFCSAMEGKSILFVGDSTQSQMFTSFVHLLGAQKADILVNACNPFAAQIHYIGEIDLRADVCNGNLRVHFVRNEYLWLDSDKNKKMRGLPNLEGGPKLLCDWDDYIATADFIVLNRGLHFSKDAPVEINQTLVELQRRRGSKPTTFIYRSTQIPIPRCSTYAEPMPQTTWMTNYSLTDGERYHWDRMEEQNQMVKEILQKGVIFLNITLLSSLRPDGHLNPADCVHYCLPGPVDDWNALLFGVLAPY